MQKVEAALGEEWSLRTEGEQLQSEGNIFRKKLDMRPVFEDWLKQVTKRNITITGRLFVITRSRATTNNLEISVNFDPQISSRFEEVEGPPTSEQKSSNNEVKSTGCREGASDEGWLT